MELTQHEKIIKTMIERAHEKSWFYPPDFMEKGSQNFVGYEASARFSELQREHPDMFESKREGKYFYRRIRYEDSQKWLETLDTDLKQKVEHWMLENKVQYQKKVQEVTFNDDGTVTINRPVKAVEHNCQERGCDTFEGGSCVVTKQEMVDF